MRSVLFSLILLIPSAASAEQVSAVRTMMDAAGLVDQYAGLGDVFRAGVLQAGRANPGLPEGQLEMLADVSARVVDGNAFLAEVEAELTGSLSPAQIDAVTAYFATPLGRRLRDAEIAAAGVEAQLDIQARTAELSAELKGRPERLAIVRRIDDLLFLSELSATVGSTLMYAMAAGMLQSEPDPADPELMDTLRAQIAAEQDTLVEAMREQLLAMFAWAYRGFSDQELAEYAAFLETDAARATFAALFAVSNDFFEARGQQIGQEFGATLRQKKT